MDHKTVKRVCAVASMMQSDKDGEVLNAAKMLVALLDRNGLRIGEVLARGLNGEPRARPQEYRSSPERAPWEEAEEDVQGDERFNSPSQAARTCLQRPDLFTDWENQFLSDIRYKASLTHKQWRVLERLARRYVEMTG